MATKQPSCSSHADDDYIDMELSSSSNFLCYSISSPPQSIEFEFQMSSVSHDRAASASPADELFYKGKLLPLLLPPRMQMVQKLLHNPPTTAFDNKKEETFEEQYAMPFTTSSTAPSTNTNTPLDSCNISPAESRRVSSELNPDEYCFEWSTEINSFIGEHPKKYSWTRKLKQSSLGQKIKASRAYLKSLFAKSGSADDSYAKTLANVEPETASKCKDIGSSKQAKFEKRSQFGRTNNNERCKKPNTLKKSIEKDMVEDSYFNSQRRSFSGAIQWHSATKSSFSSSISSSGSSSASSSSSFSSNGFYDLHFLKRSSSANSEVESPIEGAIAHCKKSQDLFSPRKTASNVGVCSFSASEIASSGDPEKQP